MLSRLCLDLTAWDWPTPIISMHLKCITLLDLRMDQQKPVLDTMWNICGWRARSQLHSSVSLCLPTLLSIFLVTSSLLPRELSFPIPLESQSYAIGLLLPGFCFWSRILFSKMLLRLIQAILEERWIQMNIHPNFKCLIAQCVWPQIQEKLRNLIILNSELLVTC